MKQFWVDVRPWNKEIATTAIESGADALVVDQAEDVRRLGQDHDGCPGRRPEARERCVGVHDHGQEEREQGSGTGKAHSSSSSTTSDWTVIPLENLVAQSDRIIARVKDEKEAQMALHVLEKGTHGILLKTDSPAMVKSVAALLKSPTGQGRPRPVHGHEDPPGRDGRPGLRGHLLHAQRRRRDADGQHLVGHAPRPCRDAREPVRCPPPVPGQRRGSPCLHPDPGREDRVPLGPRHRRARCSSPMQRAPPIPRSSAGPRSSAARSCSWRRSPGKQRSASSSRTPRRSGS